METNTVQFSGSGSSGAGSASSNKTKDFGSGSSSSNGSSAQQAKSFESALEKAKTDKASGGDSAQAGANSSETSAARDAAANDNSGGSSNANASVSTVGTLNATNGGENSQAAGASGAGNVAANEKSTQQPVKPRSELTEDDRNQIQNTFVAGAIDPSKAHPHGLGDPNITAPGKFNSVLGVDQGQPADRYNGITHAQGQTVDSANSRPAEFREPAFSGDGGANGAASNPTANSGNPDNDIKVGDRVSLDGDPRGETFQVTGQHQLSENFKDRFVDSTVKAASKFDGESGGKGSPIDETKLRETLDNLTVNTGNFSRDQVSPTEVGGVVIGAVPNNLFLANDSEAIIGSSAGRFEGANENEILAHEVAHVAQVSGAIESGGYGGDYDYRPEKDAGVLFKELKDEDQATLIQDHFARNDRILGKQQGLAPKQSLDTFKPQNT